MAGHLVPDAATRFEALAESAPDAIFTIDEHSTILFANGASERVFGYAPGELLGKRLTELIPERYRAAHEAGIARYVASGKRNIPWTGVALPGLRQDGSEVPLEICFGEFQDDEGRRLFSGFMRDVSERARQQREVEEARQTAEIALHELASVGRVMDMALASPTYEGMVHQLLRGLRQELAVDEATALLVDEKEQELVVQQCDGIVLDESVRIPMGAGLAGSVAKSGKPLAIEDLSTVDVVHQSLREQIRSLVAVPMRSGGRLIGVLHVGTRTRRKFSDADMRLLDNVGQRMAGVMARTRLYQQERTARGAAEEASRALADKEAELLRANAELEQRRQQAEGAVRSRDEVLSIVSHDLRNPVNTVMMSASLLSDPQFSLSEAQRGKQLDVIKRSAQRMGRLIQDLLDVARIEGGRFAVTCRPEDPAELVRETMESFRPLAARKQQRLEGDVAPAVPPINADRDRIIQVLSNYLNNAMKFAPAGGRIALRVSATADMVRFDVEDDGPGIQPEDLAQVFNRFWQAKRTAHLGSGLGLAIAKGIVEAHRGRVFAESMPGRGSVFSFEVPARMEDGG